MTETYCEIQFAARSNCSCVKRNMAKEIKKLMHAIRVKPCFLLLKLGSKKSLTPLVILILF
ncbi:hypothetical protein Lmac_0622 [Legionella maceachernii]|uniref:Uncharacterized protein n=1 Tax=Legionella maceachernii TaxID=466 RepID=A0A0W0WEK9_9GAMM|nr:hypothetical protein Lmac_0622 [Legionella maceachernii]SJZ69062.1 hypothetical protein SAMN02745128_00791 [Legionella maceachernii]SUP02174.1 Uncharacterised protein [Legionella maceachernii]